MSWKEKRTVIMPPLFHLDYPNYGLLPPVHNLNGSKLNAFEEVHHKYNSQSLGDGNVQSLTKSGNCFHNSFHPAKKRH